MIVAISILRILAKGQLAEDGPMPLPIIISAKLDRWDERLLEPGLVNASKSPRPRRRLLT